MIYVYCMTLIITIVLFSSLASLTFANTSITKKRVSELRGPALVCLSALIITLSYMTNKRMQVWTRNPEFIELSRYRLGLPGFPTEKKIIRLFSQKS